MTPDSRFEMVARLKAAVRDRNLAELATQYGVTIQKEGKVNKGWVGQVLDRVASTECVSAAQPDGPDYELKSVHVVMRSGEWLPKETFAITMMNPRKILEETFEDSVLWHKLERLILVGHSYPEARRDEAYVRFVAPVDLSDGILKDEVEAYWTAVQRMVREGGIAKYSSRGTSSGYVQLRTKGSANSRTTCPVTGQEVKTRAFYATKRFVNYVRGNMGSC